MFVIMHGWWIYYRAVLFGKWAFLDLKQLQELIISVKKQIKTFAYWIKFFHNWYFWGYSKFGLWPMPSFQDQSLHWNFGSEIKLKNRRCQGWVGGKRTFWIFICLRICSFWLCCGKLWLKWKRSPSWKKKFSAFLQSRGLPCGVKFCSNTSMF